MRPNAESASNRYSEPGARSALQTGFSLLEMMVALAVAGILFLVALPGYERAVIKSGRAAARAGLMTVAARQEQFFVNSKHYAGRLENLGLPEPFYVNAQGETVAVADADYHLVLDMSDGVYLGALAIPVNRQREDLDCMTFSLSRLGVKAVTGNLLDSPAECW